MPPILGFVVGALSCVLIQFGVWWSVQKGQSMRDYWRAEVGHVLVLAGAGFIFCALWANNGLDLVVAYLPEAITGSWAKSGIPYTPQVGVIAGATLAFRGIDLITAAFRSRTAASTSEGGTAS